MCLSYRGLVRKDHNQTKQRKRAKRASFCASRCVNSTCTPDSIEYHAKPLMNWDVCTLAEMRIRVRFLVDVLRHDNFYIPEVSCVRVINAMELAVTLNRWLKAKHTSPFLFVSRSSWKWAKMPLCRRGAKSWQLYNWMEGDHAFTYFSLFGMGVTQYMYGTEASHCAWAMCT